MLYHKEGGRQMNNLHQEVQVSILRNHFLTWVNTCCYPETTYFCTGVHNFFIRSSSEVGGSTRSSNSDISNCVPIWYS